ncbi:hypothetical protein BDR05DRAFT_993239 [Suillus weaverae]|nr:hypothetical protein BDR05DRAFT_993239 [Suillus weaverae]
MHICSRFISSLLAIAQLQLALINVVAVTSLCEILIDVTSGKSAEVDNTDAEGRLVLADIALGYTDYCVRPPLVLSGTHRTAGEGEYDRFWRMPLDEDYGPQISYSTSDLCNKTGKFMLFLEGFIVGIEAKDEQLLRAYYQVVGIPEHIYEIRRVLACLLPSGAQRKIVVAKGNSASVDGSENISRYEGNSPDPWNIKDSLLSTGLTGLTVIHEMLAHEKRFTKTIAKSITCKRYKICGIDTIRIAIATGEQVPVVQLAQKTVPSRSKLWLHGAKTPEPSLPESTPTANGDLPWQY